MSATRQARVRALAKLNLDLRIISKRPDGYHELRTIFQTISLADRLAISFMPARRTAVSIEDPLGIENNLAAQAAHAVLDAMKIAGLVTIRLDKFIPMGAGLGGGSSDAAAVLLALPVLARQPVELSQLCAIAAELGSDVPFFLLGGAAVGIGRGTEVFPLPDLPAQPGVVVAPEIHLSTADAYRRLSRHLTSKSQQNKIVNFQPVVWGGGVSGEACNDFEAVVLRRHPRLERVKVRLLQAGASRAMMTGSGCAIFGLFRTGAEALSALKLLKGERAFPITLVNRTRYRAMWWRALKEHIDQKLWPPRSRYAR